MKILLLANSAFKLSNFRAGLIRTLVADGHELVAATPRDNSLERLKSLGVRVVNLPMDATGTSPLREISLLFRIFRILRSEAPDAVLGYTIKPNIYGALSARLLHIPFIPNVTGLGTAFDRENLLSRIVKFLYRVAFRNCPKVFLQNPDDLNLFIRSQLIRADQAELLPGSGVDLAGFAAHPLPGRGARLTFLLFARMLRDKGVVHFAEAAQRLAPDYPQARFLLLGPLGEGKSGGLNAKEMEALSAEFPVEYLGPRDDVRPTVVEADCVVLPSFYHEGTPRSLLEAGAMGRPIITTDWPGCRDVVDNGRNGYLCRPEDSEDLADKMRRILDMTDDERIAMGSASRKRMETHFDENIVIKAYQKVLSGV